MHQINRRFAAACAAASLESRRTARSGRVGFTVELTARRYRLGLLQPAGGWKGLAMVLHYTDSVTPRAADAGRQRAENAAGGKGSGGRKRPPAR